MIKITIANDNDLDGILTDLDRFRFSFESLDAQFVMCLLSAIKKFKSMPEGNCAITENRDIGLTIQVERIEDEE